MKVAMKPIHTIGRILPSPKDPLTLEEKSCLVYQVPCFDCDFVYIGQTKRDLKSRLAEHKLAIRNQEPEKSALCEHSIQFDHLIDWNNSKVLKTEVPPDQISTSHRLPINPNSKISKTPPIIVRFVNRVIRNKLYANRKLTRSANLNKFSVAGTEKIYLNENLTQIRKKLFWKTKQKAKQMNYRYIWTTNGNIFAKKSDDEITLAIKNDLDLNLIK